MVCGRETRVGWWQPCSQVTGGSREVSTFTGCPAPGRGHSWALLLPWGEKGREHNEAGPPEPAVHS